MARKSAFKHLGGVPLGQNKSLQIVEIGNKVYLLGVGQEVQLIHILETEEELNSIKQSIQVESEQTHRLIKSIDQIPILKYVRNQISKQRQGIDNMNQFEHVLSEKLNQLKERRRETFNQWLEKHDEKVEKRDQHE